jgi:hypothetical protein
MPNYSRTLLIFQWISEKRQGSIFSNTNQQNWGRILLLPKDWRYIYVNAAHAPYDIEPMEIILHALFMEVRDAI